MLWFYEVNFYSFDRIAVASIMESQLLNISDENKTYKCHICDYNSPHKANTEKHIEFVHEGKKPHNCSLCDYACSQKGQLKRLFESVHEEKKPHKCPICNYSKTSWYTINVSQKKSCILKSLILRSIII